jgi:hypothetical protein
MTCYLIKTKTTLRLTGKLFNLSFYIGVRCMKWKEMDGLSTGNKNETHETVIWIVPDGTTLKEFMMNK